MAVNLITFSGSNVLPEYDAEARKGMTGFTTMPSVTLTGSNLLHITECYGMIAGYQFGIDTMDVAVSLPASESVASSLYLHLDTSDIDTPLALTASATPSYVYGNGVYDMEIATFTATPSGVSGLTLTAPSAVDKTVVQRAAEYAVDDIVICPSAPGHVFMCTTAGTTAAVEPTAYKDATVIAITDGSAIFERRRLAPKKTHYETTLSQSQAADVGGGRISLQSYAPGVMQAVTCIINFSPTQNQTFSLSLVASGAYEVEKREYTFTATGGREFRAISAVFCPEGTNASFELEFSDDVYCDNDGLTIRATTVTL